MPGSERNIAEDELNDSPIAVFDINYWGRDILEKLNINTIKDKVFECEEVNNGYYIRMQKNRLIF